MRELLLLCLLVSSAAALFFPTSSGGGGCCCGCGTPQPPSCGCQPACPPPQACPACPAPPSCPPPPAAYCPQVQPIYVPSCSGPTCGGCSGGGCGGGFSSGYVSSAGCGGGSCGGGGGGGGYATSGGGGYATGGGNNYASSSAGYVSGGGGGYAAPVAPASGYASTSGGSYSAPIAVAPAQQETGYSAGGGAGGAYQENVAAADDPKGGQENQSAQGPVPPGTLPLLNQAFRAPQICEPQRVKYVVLRAKKINGRPGEDGEEEAEEVERPIPLEATASPFNAKEIGDELLHGEDDLGDVEGGIQARGAPTLTDAKCNSKELRDLIMENIVRDDGLASKRQIHETSIKRFPEHTVDVICSTTGFTYLVSTTEHCEAQRDNVICFVYKRPI